MAMPDKKPLAPVEGNGHTRLIPVSDWENYHAWPPIGGLRYLIFNSKSNGINKAIRRVGRRVLIDETAFFQWVEESNRG